MKGRPLKNKSNNFSEHHYGMLIMLARQVIDHFRRNGGERWWFWKNLDINELINVGWFRQARYYESVKGQAAGIKREMLKWAFKEKGRCCDTLNSDCENFRKTKEFRRNWKKWEN